MGGAIKRDVQWFPGHMAKARRQIRDSLPLVDAVVEVLDARAPRSSANPELPKLLGGKPLIKLLNKCDAADDEATKKWLGFYREQGFCALAADCKSGKGLNAFIPAVRKLLKDKIERSAEKGMAGRPLRLMVVGVPNTGKSAFINKMAGRNRAAVEDRAGVTRQNQWYVIGKGVELLDTPGVLWPKFSDPSVGDRLAFVGSVSEDVTDKETLALRLLEIFKTNYADRLEKRYGLGGCASMQSHEILEEIGRRRGMLLRGGETDIVRAAAAFLDEYRGGRLGKITLDGID